MKQLFFVLLIINLWSCNNSSPKEPNSDNHTTSYNYAADFDKIKSAILSDNKETYRTFLMNKEKPELFDMTSMFVFTKEFKALLKPLKYKDLKVTEYAGKSRKHIELYEKGEDEEGNIYESAVSIFFDETPEGLKIGDYFAAG